MERCQEIFWHERDGWQCGLIKARTCVALSKVKCQGHYGGEICSMTGSVIFHHARAPSPVSRSKFLCVPHLPSGSYPNAQDAARLTGSSLTRGVGAWCARGEGGVPKPARAPSLRLEKLTQHQKSSSARRMAQYLTREGNHSHSFGVFLNGIGLCAGLPAPPSRVGWAHGVPGGVLLVGVGDLQDG